MHTADATSEGPRNQGGAGLSDDPLVLAGRTLCSRIILGTGRFPSLDVLRRAIRVTDAEIVTVALRRVDVASGSGVLEVLEDAGVEPLPNTAGCYTAHSAILTAKLAREAFETDWVKLEVVGDDRTLMPDVNELLRAAETLVEDGMSVLAFTSDDPIVAQRLEGVGCAAVMPLGSPIGSGMGVRNPYNLSILCESVDVPVILDAGIGTASDAALAMELGCDAIMCASAIARAADPVAMASAMHDAVRAGRRARGAGRIPRQMHAEASTPTEGLADFD